MTTHQHDVPPEMNAETPRSNIMRPLAWVLGAICFLGSLILIGFWRWSDTTRFYLATGKDGVTHKIDRKTGDVWSLRGADETAVAVLKELPPEVLSRIEGKAGYESERKTTGYRESRMGIPQAIKEDVLSPYLKGHLYNGSDWQVTEIEVFITNQTRDKPLPAGIEAWEREFREKIRLDPKSSCDFSVPTIDGQTHQAKNWSIRRAWGYER